MALQGYDGPTADALLESATIPWTTGTQRVPGGDGIAVATSKP